MTMALTMAMGWIALSAWIGMAAVMTMAWWVARRTDNGGWVDVFWSFGVGLGAVLAVIPVAGAGARFRALWCALLAACWAARLGGHIARRASAGKNDPRYAQLKAEWGPRYPLRLWLFLQAQAVVSVPLIAAVAITACRPGAFPDIRDILAGAVFVIAWIGEMRADNALHRFSRQSHNRGAVCDIGLWRWSRHPNYFFEWLNWCVWPIMSLAVAGYGWGWSTLAAPVLMYWLLVHVSGIPPLEAHMARSRGDRWHAYAARTSAFFPWPPRAGRKGSA